MAATRTILIVEDDADLQEMLAEYLRGSGYATVTAGNGQEAWDYFQRFGSPHLLILDLMMPVMNGWELRKQMLRDPVFARIPVVVMTGVANAEVAAAEIKADAWLAKPFKMTALLDLVRRCQSAEKRD
jgi:CheY-like chemotaxis protein